ncbi:MAG TPA: hemerythrin family protein, partial [Polyangiaceae bacterium]
LLLKGLDDMMQLVADHFAHEEALLELYDYPLLVEHRKTHQMIAARIDGFVQKARHSQSLFELRQELQYLDIWFVTHFNTTDQLYRGQVEDVPDSAML